MRISLNRALLAAVALAGICTRSIQGQTSGVLIGFRVAAADDHGSSRYRTFWIVRSSAPPLRAELPELLVPRQDGFWRMGIVGTCKNSDGETQIDQVWAVPVSQRAQVDGGCPTVPASSIPGILATTDSSERAGLDTVQIVCAIEKLDIYFVNARYVSTMHTSGETEQCEPRGNRYAYVAAVRHWGSDSTLAFYDVAGTAGSPALARAARTAVASALSQEECDWLKTNAEARAEAAKDVSQWYVSRSRRRWQALVFHAVPNSGCFFEAPINLRLPAAFTGNEALDPRWDVIRRTVPRAVDAISSPTRDLVVVLTPDSLVAYESDGKALGARLLAMPFARERLVMVEWALGKSVARWDAEIARLRPTFWPVLVKP